MPLLVGAFRWSYEGRGLLLHGLRRDRRKALFSLIIRPLRAQENTAVRLWSLGVPVLPSLAQGRCYCLSRVGRPT